MIGTPNSLKMEPLLLYTRNDAVRKRRLASAKPRLKRNKFASDKLRKISKILLIE